MDFQAMDEQSQRVLPADFYQREPHELAKDLLGRDLVRVLGDGTKLRGRIVELEVYGHILDRASHCHTGLPTPRTEAMFGAPGSAYIYLIYGVYHCLNIVAPSAARPSALLVRALEPVDGLDEMAAGRNLADKYSGEMPARVKRNLLSGPGKICQAMQIDLAFNAHSLDAPPLYITQGAPAAVRQRLEIARGPRVGLNLKTVGDCYHWPWRYGVRGSAHLSRPMPVK